jgi:hypothetical protein
MQITLKCVFLSRWFMRERARPVEGGKTPTPTTSGLTTNLKLLSKLNKPNLGTNIYYDKYKYGTFSPLLFLTIILIPNFLSQKVIFNVTLLNKSIK